VGAGLCGSAAGLASLVSYPALLAAGLPPLSANVTNTTAMLAGTLGAALGSRPELRGQGRRVLVLCGQAAIGGAGGALLLLGSPEDSFEQVVPWLVAAGALLLLARDRLRAWAAAATVARGARSRWAVATVVTGGYAGYFGAGAGIIMLAVLSLRDSEPLPVSNAVKNLTTGCANLVAGIVAPVDLRAAVAVGSGAVLGSWLGPGLVRVLPERPLRYAIGVAGLCLAAVLA
jgi:uncharacterized membrane protein YfcA